MCRGFGVVLLAQLAVHSQALPENLTGQIVITGITFAEGPAFDSAGNLYFVNYQRTGTFGRMRPGEAPTVWVDLPTGVNAFGLEADAAGNLYAADFNSHRLFRITPRRQITTVAQSYVNKPFQGLNDLCFDGAGNLFFTDPKGSSPKSPFGAVYRLSTAGALTEVAEEIPFRVTAFRRPQVECDLCPRRV